MTKEHLASFEDAFGDGEETYGKEIESRQTNKRPKREPKVYYNEFTKRLGKATELFLKEKDTALRSKKQATR